jgi:general secretion pathway protein G
MMRIMFKRSDERGITLIELIVVMIILGLLASLVLPRFLGHVGKSKLKAAQVQIELLGTALDTMRLDIGRYPTTDEGLKMLKTSPGNVERWNGPYIKKDVPLDPWKRPYIYIYPGEHGDYDIISHGADGIPGGTGENQDVQSWKDIEE